MKKFLCLILSSILTFTLVVPAFGAEVTYPESTFSFVNDLSEVVTVKTSRRNNTSTAKVYVNGRLTQSSVADGNTMSVKTKIYELSASDVTPTSVQSDTRLVNGFTIHTSRVAASNETIPIENVMRERSSSSVFYDEPADNTGLVLSVYNDPNYYCLGRYGNLYYAPDVYGLLYRKIVSRTYNGRTKYWQWGIEETLSTISAVVSLVLDPTKISFIIAIIEFTSSNVIAYAQAVSLDTYTFDYDYRVRVSGEIHFTAQRNITFWYGYNQTTGEGSYEQKRFNSGFSSTNSELVRAGIDHYLESIS